jgi:hypothetical protein
MDGNLYVASLSGPGIGVIKAEDFSAALGIRGTDDFSALIGASV